MPELSTVPEPSSAQDLFTVPGCFPSCCLGEEDLGPGSYFPLPLPRMNIFQLMIGECSLGPLTYTCLPSPSQGLTHVILGLQPGRAGALSLPSLPGRDISQLLPWGGGMGTMTSWTPFPLTLPSPSP